MSGLPAIGVIGIGAMGLPIAQNLHERGYPVLVCDVRSSQTDQAAEIGMVVCASAADLGRRADLVLVVVVNATQIEEVLFGASGFAQAQPSGKTVLLSSTIAPEDTVRFAARLGKIGVQVLDAPISGGPARARSGTMSMMLAGSPILLERWEPVLRAMSDKRYRISETLGDGARMKLVNNLLAGVNLVASAEALALGMRLGLDPQSIYDVVCASSGASWVFQDRMARVLQDDFAPRAFAHILTKDVGLVTAMADALEFATPLGDAALMRLEATLAQGFGELDDAAVIKTYQTR
jgi:3-hydroxyisobutyrate dehydrogenase